MDHTVDGAWERILTWLRTHAPVTAATLAPPATTDDILIIESLLGRSLPADLLTWWRHSCGVSSFIDGRLIPPRFAPYTLDDAIDCRELMLDVSAGPDDAENAVLAAQPAGTPCTYWLPPWLPLAHDGGGNYLFVDLRPGPRTGCITAWHKYEAAVSQPLWPSTTTLLGALATALEQATDIQFSQPEVHDGALDWV